MSDECKSIRRLFSCLCLVVIVLVGMSLPILAGVALHYKPEWMPEPCVAAPFFILGIALAIAFVGTLSVLE